MLFADQEDSAEEQSFTLAHKASRFLGDHYYPRQDLLWQFGPSIEPVLDGVRRPTRAEEADAIMGRTSLTLQSHLLDREGPVSRVAVREQEADLFACVSLAPRILTEAPLPSS